MLYVSFTAGQIGKKFANFICHSIKIIILIIIIIIIIIIKMSSKIFWYPLPSHELQKNR